MIREKEYTQSGYYLTYIVREEGLVITGFRGRISQLEIPEQIEGRPVRGIDKKAFLSKKTLREIRLPRTIRFIGDWAFAYCSNLEKITLPEEAVTTGKALFLECDKLQCISSCEEAEEKREAVSRLLAAAVTTLDAYYLLDTAAAGSDEWLQKWDARLFAVMEEEDMEGYHKQILCGEEDYGSTDVEAYLRTKRMKKVKLAMLRLLNARGLSRVDRQQLENYLKEHTKGCTSEETWLTLLQEYPHDTARMQLFLDLGCADSENMEAILKDIGEEYPEMKAIFLRYQDTHIGYQDFFAELSL